MGKSTLIMRLKRHFEAVGVPSLFTREPGGTAVSERLRDIILSVENKIDPLTELFLYEAARREHVAQVIIPALNEGKVVVCDRFIDSTTAYQGYGRGLDLGLIEALNSAASMGAEIDLTIFLDLPPALGFVRKGGADIKDRMDSEDTAFHERVYNGFKEIAKSKRVVTVDAGQGMEEVFKEVLRLINEKYRHKGLI
ncbi:MAG: dTMP kinase [Firmicutes bacterium]|nr:dTMP kinase [Bacillota bacterium]